MCNIAHHADIGGITPGSMAGGTEIYQEGTRIPVIRLFRQGELQADILDLLLLNARVPHERRGDYFAQVAACRLGVRRVADMIEARGLPMLEAAFDEIIRRTRDRLLEALSRIPPGEYAFEDVMDDDGIGTTDIPIKLKVIVPPHGTNQKVLFDFTGTGPQVKGNINSTVTVTLAAVLYSLKALLDPDVPNNQGLIEIVDINAPPGTLINSKFPAAVAARANTAQRIVDVVIGALAPAIPEAAVGAANGANTTAVFFGHDPRHNRDYVYLETLGGGFGGRFTKDGKDGVQVHITNTSNLPVEVDRNGVSATGRKLRLRAGLRRRRQASRRAGASACRAPGRPHDDVFRPGRALREQAVGHLRRRARRHRQVREAVCGQRSPAADQARESRG